MSTLPERRKAFNERFEAQKKSTEDHAEPNDDRTTREGLFNTAEAYRLSAEALERAELRKAKGIGHAAKPVRLLYSHAIELLLKALLRQKHSAETLRNQPYGHRIDNLISEAETLGLVVTREDRDVLAVMANTDVLLEMRYIQTGPKTPLEWIEPDRLRRTALSLRDKVAEVLLRKGDLKMLKHDDVVELGPA
jgi:HEPN domain-containing protein